MANLKIRKVDSFKVTVFSAVLCILMIVILYWYANGLQETFADLKEIGKLPNVIWLVKHLAYVIPGVAVAVVLTLFYSNKEKYVPVVVQKEKFYITLIVAAFTYLVMLPYVIISSKMGESIDPETGEAITTLLDITVNWFFVQIIPFIILVSYHAIRRGTEEEELKRELAEEKKN